MLFLLLSPALAPVTLHGQVGRTVTLTVRLPAASTGVLLNREAPNSMTLKTPWGELKQQPSGHPFPKSNAEFSDYFQNIKPVSLSIKVPTGTKPGLYKTQLALQLFTCDKKELICKQKDLNYPVTIQVGKTQKNASLDVPASMFRQSFKIGG